MTSSRVLDLHVRSTFRVVSDAITVRLPEKAVPQTIYREGDCGGRAAALGQKLGNGLVEFKLRLCQPGLLVEWK